LTISSRPRIDGHAWTKTIEKTGRNLDLRCDSKVSKIEREEKKNLYQLRPIGRKGYVAGAIEYGERDR